MPDDDTAAERGARRTITIEIMESNDFTVREVDGLDAGEGGRYCDRLTWDEMLGTIAELTHPRLGTCSYRMLTQKEWEASRMKFQQTES